MINPEHDGHMHTTFSDGSASVDEMALAAIEKGLTRIYITDHMPLPFVTRYAMAAERLDEYRTAVQNARHAYAGSLDIRTGIEIEYIPDLKPWIQSISDMGWDRQIASIHRLKAGPDVYHMVNGTREEFERLLNSFGRDIHALCRAYWAAIREACETGWFDIAGHLDVIKKHNRNRQYFDESAPDYRALVTDTLAAIKQADMKMEINTSGFNHPAADQYPSPWIVEQAVRMRIPLVLSSDSHSPRTLGQHFGQVRGLLQQPA